MLKNKLKKLLFFLILFSVLSLFSCSLFFGYNIEGTKWSGNILWVNMILEFESGGIVKTGSIELVYNTVTRDSGTYTFDKSSMTGTITIDGVTNTFSINEQTKILTLSVSGISITFQDVTATFTWPIVNAAGCRYVGVDYENELEIEIYFSNKTSGTIKFTDIYSYDYITYQFTATWNDETYSGKINFSTYFVDYQISLDKQYCVFNYLSDNPIYCELQ
ncbi:MAG: hypothetical protein GYA61_02695 [Spirochaetales bacterium]|nr:hypothetical protein [Spirochaetales bacterium]